MDFATRLACLKELPSLGWGNEVSKCAQRLLTNANQEQRQRVFVSHQVLGISDLAFEWLVSVRDDGGADLLDRIDAAEKLFLGQWQDAPSSEFLEQLLRFHAPAETKVAIFQFVSRFVKLEGERSGFGLIERLFFDGVLEIVGSIDPTVENLVPLLGILDRDFQKVRIPTEILVSQNFRPLPRINREICDILTRQGESDEICPMLSLWVRVELDNYQLFSLAELALEFECIDVASKLVDKVNPRLLEDHLIEQYSDLLWRTGAHEQAESALRNALENADEYSSYSLSQIKLLLKWELIDLDEAINLAMSRSDGSLKPTSLRTLLLVEFAELGALPNDPAILVDALSEPEVPFLGKLAVCDIISKLKIKDPVHHFLIDEIHSGDYARTLPSCASLVQLIPEKVTLRLVQEALSPIGKFEIEPLIDICCDSALLPECRAIQEEIAAFVSYCDLDDKSLKEFVRGLVEGGAMDIALRFAVFLQIAEGPFHDHRQFVRECGLKRGQPILGHAD